MVLFLIRRGPVVALVAAVLIGCAPRSSAVDRGTAEARSAPLPASTLANVSDRFFVAGDVRLRYREAGRGDPVVLLHGATRNLEDWVQIGDSLAVDHRVIALDLRGHGQSSKFTERARFGSEMVDDVVRLLDHLQIQRAHLIGHSLGAVVAANVAARYPTRVATVSLVAPPLYADWAAYMQVYAAALAELESGAGMVRYNQLIFPGISDSVATAWSVAALAATPAPTLAAVFGSMSALMIPPSAAASVRGLPTLIAVGTDDPLLRQARWVASWWPDARVLELPGANHGTVMGRPELWTAVRQLLRTRATSALLRR